MRSVTANHIAALSAFALITLAGCPQTQDAPDEGTSQDMAPHDMRNEADAPTVDDMVPDAADMLEADLADASVDAEESDLEDLGEPVRSSREHLRFETMLEGGRAPAPSARVPLSAFAPSADAIQSDTSITGTLTFRPRRSAIAIERDDYKRALIPDIEELPTFEVTVRTVEEGALLATRPWFASTTSAIQRWWVIPGAGRVWSEPAGDGEDHVRVAMPLTLVEAHENCSFHGLMTAVYDKNNQIFSDTYYQFSQETCLYFKAPLWGWLATSFEPKSALSLEEDAWIGETVAARRTRLPVAPLSALDALGVRTENFLSSVTREHITAHGALVDGVHYRGDCMTRDGAMPWCEELVVPSYSTAKSLIAGLAYLALKKEMRGLESESMGAHLEEVPEGWRDVTVGELLDMRSGHYESVAYMVDEASTTMGAFFLARGDAEKYAAALAFPEGRGASQAPWVYHTSDTFLATRVMQAILQARHSSELMVWLEEEVFAPIALSMTARRAYLHTTREDTGERQHQGGYGSFWHVDDLLRIVQDLVEQERGDLSASELRYDLEALRGVLQRREDQGTRAHDESVHVVENVHYFKGFWAIEVGPSDGFPCEAVIPFLSGFGGLTVAILPNDAIYYVIGDGDEFLWFDAAKELAKLPGFCQM